MEYKLSEIVWKKAPLIFDFEQEYIGRKYPNKKEALKDLKNRIKEIEDDFNYYSKKYGDDFIGIGIELEKWVGDDFVNSYTVWSKEN